jgi:hypothetical protein
VCAVIAWSVKWIAVGAVILGGGAAPASVVRHQDVADLTRSASDVVHGVVTARVSFRDEGQGRIVTHTTVRVDRVLKGGSMGAALSRDIVVRQMGGRIGNVASFVEGDPIFRVGEEVVLFLERNGQTHTLLSLAQAKFTVKTDRAGNKFAVRDMRGLVRVVSPMGGGEAPVARRVALNGEGAFMLNALFSEVVRALAK